MFTLADLMECLTAPGTLDDVFRRFVQVKPKEALAVTIHDIVPVIESAVCSGRVTRVYDRKTFTDTLTRTASAGLY